MARVRHQRLREGQGVGPILDHCMTMSPKCLIHQLGFATSEWYKERRCGHLIRAKGINLTNANGGGIEISNDRQLLNLLDLSDAVAAEYLSKSRQTLNTMLKSEENAPKDYFRLSDIYLLISAAARSGRVLSEAQKASIRQYVQSTRAPASDEAQADGRKAKKRPRRDYEMLMARLQPTKSFDEASVHAAIYILPAFSEMKNALPQQHDAIREEVEKFQNAPEPIELFCVSTTEFQAQMTGAAIGLNDVSNRCVGKAIVDHYQPMVLYYLLDEEIPKCKILTEQGLVDAPFFRADMIKACVEGLLDANQRVVLNEPNKRLPEPKEAARDLKRGQAKPKVETI